MLPFLRAKHNLFYGWVVIATLLIIGTSLWGIRLSFGVFFKSIENDFDLSRTATSGVFSVYLVLSSLFALLAGWAVDRYGPRITTLLMGLVTGFSLLLTSQINSPWQLFITYSLLLAAGTGTVYVVVTSTASRWFAQKRGLALGIAGSGGGWGMLFIPPLATFLISNFSWRMAFVVMGLMSWLIVIPLSRLLKKDPHEIGALPDGANPALEITDIEKVKSKRDGIQPTDFSLPRVLKTSSFRIFLFIWLLEASCRFFIVTHIVPHATDIGIPAEEAAIVLGLIGGGGIAGRVAMGRTLDIIGIKVTAIICALLTAGTMIWLIWVQDLWMFYLFALVHGFTFGGLNTTITVLIAETFGLRNIGLILGLLDIGWGVGAAIGPAMGGLIFDVTNSYSLAFLLVGGAMFMVTFLIIPIKRETNRALRG